LSKKEFTGVITEFTFYGFIQSYHPLNLFLNALDRITSILSSKVLIVRDVIPCRIRRKVML